MLFNKKSIYQEYLSRDLSLRTNHRSGSDIPSLTKIDISIIDINTAFNEKQLLPILCALELLSGKKPVFIKSRKVIPQFNIRKGVTIGAKVSLRGDCIYYFMEKLSFLVFSKQPIDHYFNKKSIDKQGNITLSLKDPLIFPELEREFDKFSNLADFSININASTNTREEGLALFSYLNIPFD